MPAEITNNMLAKIDWIGFITVLVLGGIAWGSHGQRLTEVEEDGDYHASNLKAVNTKVVEVDRKLGVMEANQAHFKDQIDQIRRDQRETRVDQKEILRLLRERSG